jgi:DNA-binding NtrC family response regulator
MARGKILSVSYDRTLLRTRTLLLTAEGYEITTAENVTSAEVACKKGRFDLAIVGHSIPLADQAEVVDVVRRECPGAPVLLIRRSDSSPELEQVDYTVNAQDGPGVLLKRVNSIFESKTKRQADGGKV